MSSVFNNTGNRKGPACMIAASICWSLGGVCIKFIPWSAMSIICLRSILAALVFIVYRRSIKINLTWGNILAALSLSGTTITFVFANKMTSAAAAILLQFTAPVFIILIHFIFYKKRPKISEAVAVCVTVLGMMLFFTGNLGGGVLFGNIVGILSGVCFASLFVCNKRPDTNPEQALLLGFIINSFIGLPFIFIGGGGVTADLTAWIAVIILGVVQVGIAYMFFSAGIKKTPALLACLISAVEPVLNPLWVVLASPFLEKPDIPGPFALMGGAVIILSITGYNIWTERVEKLERLEMAENKK